MNKVIKYLLSIISKIFSFSIFSFIFLLLFLQFGTLNLQFLDPIIKSNFADKYLTSRTLYLTKLFPLKQLMFLKKTVFN